MAFIENQTYFDSVLMTVSEEGGRLALTELIEILTVEYADDLEGDIDEIARKTVLEMVADGVLSLSTSGLVSLNTSDEAQGNR